MNPEENTVPEGGPTMKLINATKNFRTLSALALIFLFAFVSRVSAGEQEDRVKIENLVTDYMEYFVAEDEDNLMSLVSDNYQDSWHDKKSYRERIREIFNAVSDWESACTVKLIIFPEPGKASVVLDGTLEGDLHIPKEMGRQASPCNEFWELRGGNFLSKENGAWKIAGSHEKISEQKISAGLYFTSPTDAQVLVKLRDESGGITEAKLLVPGIEKPIPLLKSVEEKNKKASWSTEENPQIDVRQMIYPMKLVIEYSDSSGTDNAEYRIDKPEISFPVPQAPADTISVVCPIEFKWKGIDAAKGATAYSVNILDKDGINVASLDSDSEHVTWPCAGKLDTGAVYFYRVIASDGKGNYFASGLESFRAGPPADGAAIRYTFSGPEDILMYSDRPATWVGGIYLYKDKIVLAEFLNQRIDILDATIRQFKYSFVTERTPRDFCVADEKVFVEDPLSKSIKIFAFDGTQAGEWEFDSGETGGPLLCDEKNGRVLAANLETGTLITFNMPGEITNETTLPEGTAAVGLDENGNLLFAGENGSFSKYSRDGEKIAEWNFPENIPRVRGVAVFDGSGNLAGFVNPTFNSPEAVENYPLTIKEVDGRIYAGYLLKNECGRCGMFFDAAPGGEPIFGWDFK